MRLVARTINIVLGRTALIMVASTSPLHAQAVVNDPSELQEIIVTAQRRSESSQEVPQSLYAISGDKLERGAISGLADLTAYVPGLVYNQNAGTAGGQVILRGITSGNDVNATVAMYVNDVPYGSGTSYSGTGSFALDLGSFDLQRVEVLRGPQGTLYGASAFGGVVKYVLTPPSLTSLEGVVQVEGSQTANGGGNYAVRAAVNLPLSDTWAVRLTGIRNHDDGYIDNIDSAGNVENHWNPTNTTVGRLSVLGAPTSELTLRAMVLTQDINQDGSSRVDIDPTTLQPAYGRLVEQRDLIENYRQAFRLYSVGADYDFGFATLTGTASYQDIRSDEFQDVALFADLLGPISAAAGMPIDRTAIPQSYDTQKSTAELRLISPANHDFEWLAGFFYTQEKNDSLTNISGYLNGVFVPFDFFTLNQPTTYQEFTGYADATYYFTPRLDAQIGARLTHNEQTVTQFSSGVLGGPNEAAPDVDNTVGTYLATLRFHFDDKNMAYARAASGYRPGGPNLVIPDPVTGKPAGTASFKPDKLWNYELGVKLEPARWLLVDTSVFYIDWKDIQLQGISNGLGIFENGGKATSKGVETSVEVRPTQAWTVNGSFAYTAAKLVDAVPDLGASAGQQLPNVPRVATTIATDYKFQVLTLPGDVGAAWNYTSKRNAGYVGSDDLAYVPMSSYSTVDLHAGLDWKRINFNIYAKNIFDKWAIVGADTSDTLYRAAVLRPRTIGLMITAKF